MSATPPISSSEEQARRLEAVYEQLVTSLHSPVSAQKLADTKSDTEWSVSEVLGHMVEMIPYWLVACRTIIDADAPPTFGRSLDAPERLAGVERGASTSLPEMLALLQQEVQQGAAAIRAMSDAERVKQGINPARGTLTVAGIVEMLIVSHAEGHLAQIQGILAE